VSVAKESCWPLNDLGPPVTSHLIVVSSFGFVFQENEAATIEDLEKPGVDEEPQAVLLRSVISNAPTTTSLLQPKSD